MEVREISKNEWSVKVTDEDKKKIACIVQKLKSVTDYPPYGKWKNMSSEEIWEEILIQFCVMAGAQPIERLMANEEKYNEFLTKLSIDNLLKLTTDRAKYISNKLKEFKATRFYNKRAKKIKNCLENEEIVRDGKVTLLEDLRHSGTLNEDQIRDVLLKKMPFFKVKSISDFMITIGATKGFIAFDTRIIGLLNKYFGLNIWTLKSGKLESDRIADKIQSNGTLYKKIEQKLRDVCRELGIELSLLDRVLFQCARKSAIEYILETECG